MKKSIGLYADTRDFKTTLPQTKHLNFFMQTNPQGYANGGQVRAGIPQSNMKVTSGFLPMALGYDSGGEGFSFAKLYEAATIVAAQYLNLAIGDPKVKLVADQIMNTEEGQEYAKKLLQRASTRDVETEVKAQEGALNVPTQTFDGSTKVEPPFGAVDVTPDITMRQSPVAPSNIDREREIKAFEDSPRSAVAPGILGLQSKEAGTPPSGSVDTQGSEAPKKEDTNTILNSILEGLRKADDYIEEAAEGETGLDRLMKKPPSDVDREREIKALEKSQLEGAQKTDDGGITSITPSGPDVDKEREVKESEKQKIKPKLKIKPERDKKGDEVGSLVGAVDSGIIPKISKEEAEGTSEDIAKLTGNEGKKDIPEWALPLASAGFAMMASKSPNFLQALGEAGQAGIATLSSQREAEEAKLDKAAERKYRNAMADFYEKGGSQSKGGLQAIGGKLYYKNTGEPYMIGAGDNQIHAKVELTRADAIEILGGANGYPGFLDIPNDDPRKEEIIQGYLNLVNGGNAALGQKVQSEATSENEGSWWSNLFNLPKIDQYLEDAAEG